MWGLCSPHSLLQACGILGHMWKYNYVSALWHKLYLNCGTGTAAKAALLWPNGLPQPPPFQTDERMHRFSSLPKCPWFPQSPVNGPQRNSITEHPACDPRATAKQKTPLSRISLSASSYSFFCLLFGSLLISVAGSTT